MVISTFHEILLQQQFKSERKELKRKMLVYEINFLILCFLMLQ